MDITIPSVRNRWDIIKARIQGYPSLCGYKMLDRNPGRLTSKTLKENSIVLERVLQLALQNLYPTARIAVY